MKFRMLPALLSLASLSLWAADTLKPLDVKTGQWESTYATQTAGPPPIPPEILAKMTPEQRARLEERAKGLGGGGKKVTKHCFKKEDLDKALSFGPENKSCTRTLVTSNAHKQELQIECNSEHAKSGGTIVLEAVDSEHVKGNVHISMTSASGKPWDIDTTFTAKWIGPSCTS